VGFVGAVWPSRRFAVKIAAMPPRSTIVRRTRPKPEPPIAQAKPKGKARPARARAKAGKPGGSRLLWRALVGVAAVSVFGFAFMVDTAALLHLVWALLTGDIGSVW